MANGDSLAVIAKNPWMLLFIGAISGGTSGTFLGSNALEDTEMRLRELEKGQALDDQHRIDAVNGYFRIRGCEKGVTQCETNMQHFRERLDHLENLLERDGLWKP